MVEHFDLLTLRFPSSHLVVTLPQHISRYPQYIILYCRLVYWHVGISLGIKSCRKSPFLELTHWSPIKEIRWKMTLPLGIISLITPIARCGNGMVVNLKRCKDGMVVNLERSRDGVVVNLERYRDGMVVYLERSRDGMVGNLERCRDGMVVTLERSRDGMDVNLERCRDGMFVNLVRC